MTRGEAMIEGFSARELVEEEIKQRRQEGCAVSDYDLTGLSDEELEKIYLELSALKVKADFPFYEPNDLDEILKNSDGSSYKKEPDKKDLHDKFYGAWLGRIIGCIMGKPVERSPYGGGDENFAGWEYVKLWQQGASDPFPPDNYISGKSSASEKYSLKVNCPDSLKENIRFAESDDDIRYLVLGLLINEKYGNDFTPSDVAGMWQKYLPLSMCFTAERAALINSVTCPETDPAKQVEFCHGNRNPYREWIGAQIRADHYGYYNAGDPLAAAKSAYNDAIFSHVKNGVYGSMFVAALTAAAFTEKDAEKCIEIALSVIPNTSRLYADVLFAVKAAKSSSNAEELYSSLWSRFSSLSPVHTNNNAAVCAAALIKGGGDFAKSVGIAVGAGWDTDCNGATVGSVAGIISGAEGIPDYLKNPLGDTLYSSIPDFHPAKISLCAERSEKLYLSRSK